MQHLAHVKAQNVSLVLRISTSDLQNIQVPNKKDWYNLINGSWTITQEDKKKGYSITASKGK